MSHSFIHPRSLATLCVAAAVVLTAATSFVQAAEKKPKYSVEDIMKAINKGDDNICKRIGKGTASKEDIAKMVEYYEQLPLNKAPKGEDKSWHEKTTALVKAAKALKAGEPDAAAKFKDAVNCKACHSAHKPD